MDAGSEIDWSVLENQSADIEAAENFSSEPEAWPSNEDEAVDEEVEDPRVSFEAQDALIEACQKYFEIQIDEIEPLALPSAWVAELQDFWEKILQRVGGRQSAGELIYDAILEAAPRIITDDFSTFPRTVWSSRFLDGLAALITELSDAEVLRNRAEAMGFSHLSLAVTFSKCELFRDVIEYLKTSMTRLYFVADRIFEMTFEMYENPRKMVQDITSVGLMHVGMNIPREFFKPFAVAAMQTFEDVIKQDVACLGFSWSISLIGRVMERVIAEGSTVVMKAICLNQENQLSEAMAVAPRAERAQHLLVVSAGEMSTSPLYWSIDSGHLGCARIIIEDLLTVRADRDNYYYGCDTPFHVHPDLIHHLCNNAPTLLGPLLDGLVWKSRSTHNGLRRVNYFMKNLLQDKDGNFSKSIEWLVNYGDPKAISHPASALAVNLVWSGLAVRYFLAGRVFFLISLFAFMAGQAAYVHHDGTESYVDNLVVASCRAFTYFLSMTSLLSYHIKHLYVDCVVGNVVHRSYVPIPLYLCNSRQLCSLSLGFLLVLMVTLEPVLWCLGEFANPISHFEIFTTNCPAATDDLKNIYSVCASLASLLYWFLLTDLAVFSMRLYALLLVCEVVAMELILFPASALFLILSFSTALNALDHSIEDFEGVPRWAKSLGQIVINMLPTSFYYGIQSSATVFLIMSLFVGLISFVLVNLLAVQLMEAYAAHSEDLQGCAQLSRAAILVRSMEQVQHNSWSSFLKNLQFDEPLEFNEGDVGLAGGVQVLENAQTSVITVDRIQRYGGLTGPSLPWPLEEKKKSLRQERFQRLETLFLKAERNGNSFGRKAAKKRSLTFTNAMAMFGSSVGASDASGVSG